MAGKERIAHARDLRWSFPAYPIVCLGARVMGCCHASLAGTFIGEGARIVSVTTVRVDPQVSGSLLGGKVALRLVKGIKVWARARGATHILYHVTAG